MCSSEARVGKLNCQRLVTERFNLTLMIVSLFPILRLSGYYYCYFKNDLKEFEKMGGFLKKDLISRGNIDFVF